MRGFHACTPRIDEPGPTCNQLSAAIRSSNGDRYGIGERLPIVCDRVRRILIGGERERERRSDRYNAPRRSSFDREKDLDSESMDGIGPIPRSKFSSSQGRAKFGFVGGWGKLEGEGGRNGDCRERGNQRRRPRFATNNLWLKLFRSPSPPADTPWPTTSAVTRGPRFQSRTADVLVLVLLVFRTGEGGHSRGALSLSLLFFCEYWWTTLVKKSRYDKPSREIITN